jgi:hypothetical protein
LVCRTRSRCPGDSVDVSGAPDCPRESETGSRSTFQRTFLRLVGLGNRLAVAGSRRSVPTTALLLLLVVVSPAAAAVGKQLGRGNTTRESRAPVEPPAPPGETLSHAAPRDQSLETHSDVGIRAVRDRNSSWGARCSGIVSSSGVAVVAAAPRLCPRGSPFLRSADASLRRRRAAGLGIPGRGWRNINVRDRNNLLLTGSRAHPRTA